MANLTALFFKAVYLAVTGTAKVLLPVITFYFFMGKDRQFKIETDFYNRYLPGQTSTGVFMAGMWGKKYLGIDYFEATVIAQGIADCIFQENPAISKKDFEKEMLYRIPIVHKLAEDFGKELVRKGYREKEMESFAGSYYAGFFFNTIAKLKLSFKGQTRSFRLTAKIIPQWLRQKQEKIGEYSLTYSMWHHPETPLSAEIRDSNGKIIATLGGFLCFEGKQATIRLTNVQGIRSGIERYKQFNQSLGENWRVFFTKKVVEVSKIKGIPVVAELPSRYAHLVQLCTDKDYKRQLRQSKQTYRKAGLTEQQDKTWRLLPQKRIRR